MSKRGESRFGEHSRFVDALREFLGLAPLYVQGSHRTEAERFALPPHGDGCRQMPRRGAPPA